MKPDIVESEKYALGSATISLMLAHHICDAERSDRRAKMARVIKEKARLFEAAASEFRKQTTDDTFDPLSAERSIEAVEQWTPEQKVTLLIDAYFSNPFLPYELKYSTKVFESAWQELGGRLGIAEKTQDSIRATVKAARSAHRHTNWLKIGLIGGSAAAVFAVGGWFAAPVLGSMLGTAAGLSGAAAVGHGLALLGGGTLAAGGAGMAGGMWLVTATAAGTAGLFATTAQVAFNMGKQQFMTEVVKLQVSLKVRVVEHQISVGVAQSKIAELHEQRKRLEAILVDEQKLNDKNSQRLKDLEAKVKAITDAVGWLKKEVIQ